MISSKDLNTQIHIMILKDFIITFLTKRKSEFNISPIKLSKEEIILLTKAYKDVYKYLNKLEESSMFKDLPVFVKKPGIRSELSEGTVYHLINEGLILEELVNPVLNRNKADILAEDRNSDEVKIEIKGTGLWEFSQLTKKDVNADYLIWVNYGNYINDDNKENIDVYILKNPKDTGIKPDKISLKKFIDSVGNYLELVEIDPLQFKVIRRQHSVESSKTFKKMIKNQEKRISRIQILGILAINGMEAELEIFKALKDDNKARDKFRQLVQENKKLQDYVIEESLENRF